MIYYQKKKKKKERKEKKNPLQAKSLYKQNDQFKKP